MRASTRDQLLVMSDGTFVALPSGTYTAGEGQKYIDEGVVQSFSFGPLLVNDGEAVELPSKYIISTKDTIREPRTAIGQVDANHYVVIVADGRRDGWSDKGMTLQELQKVFVEQGCKVAYNLDGGGSATMVMGRASASTRRAVPVSAMSATSSISPSKSPIRPMGKSFRQKAILRKGARL